MTCCREGCGSPARFSVPLELQAGHIRLRYLLQLCEFCAEELPWLVRMRELRIWAVGLTLGHDANRRPDPRHERTNQTAKPSHSPQGGHTP